MKKLLKENKGITLIALIITIVVLLILAVVTISAVSDGGIFTHAQSAANKSQLAAEEEAIKLALSEWKMKKYDSVNSQTFAEYMIARFSGMSEYDVSGEGTIVTLTGPSGNTYSISEDGTITSLWSYNSSTKKYVKGNESYEIGDLISNDDVLLKLGIQSGTGTYTGTWKVIGSENGKLKLVSNENLPGGKVNLGKNDSRATDENIEGHLESTATDLEKVIWSYNHIDETLRKVVQEKTGIESARSIKLEDIQDILEFTNTSTAYGKVYKYVWYDNKIRSKTFDAGTTAAEIDELWNTTTYNPNISTQTIFYSLDNKVIDENHTSESSINTNTYLIVSLNADQIETLGNLISGTYWLDLPELSCEFNNIKLYNGYISNGLITSYFLGNSTGTANGGAMGVRAVVYI